MKYCTIYLFRHAQTYYNKAHRFTGWKDSQLTPLGKKQAKLIANKLKTKKFQIAYHTRLSRSKDTLNEVLKFHPECKMIVRDDRIIERSYGNLQGRYHSAVSKEYGLKMYNKLVRTKKLKPLTGKERKKKIEELGNQELHEIRRDYKRKPPGGESEEMVERRVKLFLKELLKLIQRQQVNVAISAHGNSMRPFRKHFEKLSRKEMMNIESPWDDYFAYKVPIKAKH